MKRASIKLAILVPVLAILVAGVFVMVVVVGSVATSSTNDLTDRLVDARVNEYTNEFRVISRDGNSVVRTMASVVDNLSKTSADPRVRILQTLEEILLVSDSSIKSVWTCWEPNALDGKDAEYANADALHDETGRYAVTVYRNGSSVGTEPLVGYDDPVDGEFYQGAKISGKPYITDPYEYTMDGVTQRLYTICIPIVHDGVVVGGVGADFNLNSIISIMNAGKILDDGNLSVISPSGLFATSTSEALIMKDYKSIWLNQFASEIDLVLKNGGSFSAIGYSDVLQKDVRILISGVMIGDTGRYWGICGLVPIDNINASSSMLTLLVIVMGVALVLIIGVMTFLLIRSKLRNLPVITEMANKISLGDINLTNVNRERSQTNNEITLLERSFASITDSIKDQSEIMTKIASGDYSLTAPVRSDVDIMNKSINSMIERMSDTLNDIQASTTQVATGAKQVADGAQALAQGSTEQAAAVQQLSSSVSELAQKTKGNAEMAERASTLANTIKENAERGSQQMSDMMDAVKDINHASQDISRVIKVIDDIAFQTNILALNASVEAARAGQHGKGFAVVAEEVRNLAAKSAEAAKETGNLIQNSIEKAELGSKIANETSVSLTEIVDGINESSQIVGDIAVSSEEQSYGIRQINIGIDQVAQVVQQNSATAQESAAASEEMSSQSSLLDDLITKFKLKDSLNSRITPELPSMRNNTPSKPTYFDDNFGKY